RASLIDGVVPPDVNWQTEVQVSFWGAIEGLSNACMADPLCSDAYGPVDQALLDMITNLDADPLVVGGDRGPMMEITGADAAGVIRRMMYSTALYPIIPLVITSFRDRNLEPVEELLMELFGGGGPGDGIAEGMHWSVKCSDLFNPEIGPGIEVTLMEAQIPEPLATLAMVSHDDVVELCESWPKPTPDPSLATPVNSGVPTLVSSGSFDPVTPPSFGETVGASLTNAREVVFANSGHGAILGGDCSTGLAVAFLLDPQGVVDAYDTSCADEIGLQFMVTAQSLLEGLTPAKKLAIQRQLRRGQ
ncbi:MAG: alpha/beta hydrolase, partial [Deltaproteobacteria bacterium]|nr:alpha/beta hydrolase [Deltaproteobacteria bacterium]